MFFEIIPTLMFYCFFLPCTLRNNAHTCHSSSAPVVVSSNNTNTCILTRHGNTWLHPHLSISYVMGDSSSYATWDKIHPPCTGTVLDISVDTKFSKRFCTLTLISTDYYGSRTGHWQVLSCISSQKCVSWIPKISTNSCHFNDIACSTGWEPLWFEYLLKLVVLTVGVPLLH
jgi:hypothetical protein